MDIDGNLEIYRPLRAILSFVNQTFAKLFPPSEQSYLYTILPHPTEAKVLMQSENDSYFLPSVHVTYQHIVACLEPRAKH